MFESNIHYSYRVAASGKMRMCACGCLV